MLKCIGQLFHRMLLNVTHLLNVFYDYISIIQSWPEYQRSDAPFSLYHVMGYVTSICLLTDDIHFGNLGKMVIASFLP